MSARRQPCGCVLAGPHGMDWLGPLESLCGPHRAASKAHERDVRLAVDEMDRAALVAAHPYPASITSKTKTADLRLRECAVRAELWAQSLAAQLVATTDAAA